MSADSYQATTALTDTITVSSVSAPAVEFTWSDPTYSPNSNITAGITNTGAVTGSVYNGPYTISNTIGTSSNIPWMNSTLGQVSAPKIKLDGEGADIEINGWSLVDAVKRIEERLAIMQPNPKLEEEWTELKQLGEQYRKLEQHILEKQATWDRLKAMAPPEIA
jgi:hypothetical protein